MTREVFLNGATVMTTSTEKVLAIARETGFSGIEARAERLLQDSEEVAATQAAVRINEVWSLNGVRLSVNPDGSLDRTLLIADLKTRLAVTREIRAAYLLAVPPRLPGLTADRAMDGIREALTQARDRADTLGIKVAFEFLGFADCPINTPALAATATDGVDGVALVLDSCHWHASGAGPLDGYPVERIAMVHLNDAPAKPRRLIEDADRVMPGDGVIRLRDLVNDLEGRGYRGPYSLETFNPGYWEQPPLEVATRGKAALDRLFARVP